MGVLKDLKALVQGLQIAGKHLGRHAVTIQYPEERDEIPERSRGMVVLLSDKETGEINCTACMLCERACPTGAINIDAPRGDDKKKQLKQFIVDHSLCCFCGMCEEACNFSAIKLATKYEFPAFTATDLVWEIETLQQWGKDVPYEDTRRRRNPVHKIGPAAETEGANTTVEIEKKRQEEEKAAKAAAEAKEGGEKEEKKPSGEKEKTAAKPKAADKPGEDKSADNSSASGDGEASDDKDASDTDNKQEGKA
jgi:NADH-quinone oxidoreductase subunit I